MTEELQAALRVIARELKTTKAVPELWDTKGIADYMGKKKRTVERLAASPGFPRPICARGRKWFADEVVKFLRVHRRAA